MKQRRTAGIRFSPVLVLEMLLSIVLSLRGEAACYFVSPRGADTAEGLSEATALATPKEAISRAQNGDTIQIAEGTYSTAETLSITNAITIVGAGIDKTILTTPQKPYKTGYRTVYVNNADAVLSNATIICGQPVNDSSPRGLGVLIDTEGGTVARCRITGARSNSYHLQGGGASLSSPNALLTHCIINDNETVTGEARGAGVCVGSGIVDNCLIYGNKSGFGGGLAVDQNGGAIVRNCTITGNEAMRDGGGLYWISSKGSHGLVNTIIVGNKAPKDVRTGSPEWAIALPVARYEPFMRAATTNCLFGFAGTIGKDPVTGDPCFRNAELNDFSLEAGSAAIGAGVSYEGIAETDLAGAARVPDTRIDIGCYAFDTTAFSCGFTADRTAFFEEESTTFRPTVYGAPEGIALSYSWTLSDGNGTPIAFSGENPSRPIPQAGWYDAELVVSDGTGLTKASLKRPRYIHVAARTNYLATAETPAYPWKTRETACDDLNVLAAEAIDGSVIIATEGIFEVTNQVDLTVGASILGQGIDKTTIVPAKDAQKTRLFFLNHPDALLKGLTVKGAWHDGNYYDYGNGVCIYAHGGTMRLCRVTACTVWKSFHHLGAVGVIGADGLVSRCIIDCNTNKNGECNGSGVALAAGCIENSLIRDNISLKVKGGGALYLGRDAKASVRNCTFVNNASTGSQAASGGIYAELRQTGSIVNCIFANNKADDAKTKGEGWPEWSFLTPANKDIVQKCLFSDAVLPGADSVEGDPRFKNPANGDFRLGKDSPAWNAGKYESWMADAVDLDGNPRVDYKQRVDIGCYETVYSPDCTLMMLR